MIATRRCTGSIGSRVGCCDRIGCIGKRRMHCFGSLCLRHLHILQHGPQQLSHGRGQDLVRHVENVLRHTLRQLQAKSCSIMSKMIAVAVKQVVAGLTVAPRRHLLDAPGLKLRLRGSRAAELEFLQRKHLDGLSKSLGSLGLDALSKEILLAVDDNGCDNIEN